MVGVLALVLANIGASQPDPARGGVKWAAQVAVTDETLEFDCVAIDGEPRCTFVATYDLAPVTEEPAPIAVRFIGTKVSDVTLELDGRPLTGVLALQRPGRLVARGTMQPGRYQVPSYARSAMSVRHPVFGTPVSRSNRFDLEYAISPVRSWAGPPPRITVRLRAPPAWKVELAGDEEPLLVEPDGSWCVDASTVSQLRVRLDLPPRTVFAGGPFLGLGWMSGEGVWTRVGYEFASPSWLFFSVSAETDLRRILAFVPMVSLASESLLGVIPSVSVGAGFPMEFLNGPPRLGARLQLGAQWPYAGLVGGADLFIAAGASLRGFVMVQVGL
jgi:hypothetical protein